MGINKYAFLIASLMMCLTVYGQSSGPAIKVLGVEVRPIYVTCSGLKDGAIRLALLNGIPPVVYQWSGVSSSGNGALDNIDPIDILSGLSPGTYNLTLTNGSGQDTVIQTTVIEPPVLGGNVAIVTSFHGYDVSCYGGNNGIAKAIPAGGTPPYLFAWSTGTTTAVADSLAAGQSYLVTVTDLNYCTTTLSVQLKAPPPLDALVIAEGDKCFGENAGIIDIKSVTGGVGPPYLTILNNGIPTAQMKWDHLIPGNYFLAILDGNGCEKLDGVVLPTGLTFILHIGPDSAMYSGDTLRYVLNANHPLGSAIWTPSGYASSPNPGEVLLFPYFSTTFTIHAVDTNGCKATDNVFIKVHHNRSVYIPNVFTPEGNIPENRSFTVFGSGGIATVVSLRVFDRFGRLWFENQNFPVNQPDEGWYGRYGGEKAYPGVYVYHAVLRFTDGREETFTGDVTLVR
jgi:hypothetical protein